MKVVAAAGTPHTDACLLLLVDTRRRASTGACLAIPNGKTRRAVFSLIVLMRHPGRCNSSSPMTLGTSTKQSRWQ